MYSNLVMQSNIVVKTKKQLKRDDDLLVSTGNDGGFNETTVVLRGQSIWTRSELPKSNGRILFAFHFVLKIALGPRPSCR